MAANKGAHAPAEPPEGRAGTKGNPGGQGTRRTQCRASVPQAAGRMRQAAGRSPKERLAALFRHVAPETLAASRFALKEDAAAGVDGATRAMCGEGPESGCSTSAAACTAEEHAGRRLSGGRDARAGRRDATARDRGAGGQDRPESGCGRDPDASLRGGVSRIQLRVPAGQRRARRARCPGLRNRAAKGRPDRRRGLEGVFRRDPEGLADRVPRASHRRQAGDPPDPETAGCRRHGRRGMDGHGCGNAAGEHRVPEPGERVPALRARSAVPREMASKGSSGRSDHRPLRGRRRGRVPTRAGRGAAPPRRPGAAGSLRSRPPPGQDPPRRVWTVRVGEPSRARGGQAGNVRLPGLAHFCARIRRGRFRLGRKPVAKRVDRTLARIDEVLRERRHHDIREVGEWPGRVLHGWLDRFAVPGSGRWLRAFRHRLQRLWLRALRQRSRRRRLDWKRLERMTEIPWPRVSIRHPRPDRRFAVRHPGQEPDGPTSMSGSVRGVRQCAFLPRPGVGLGNDPSCPAPRLGDLFTAIATTVKTRLYSKPSAVG